MVADSAKRYEHLDPVRHLVMERLRELRLTLADASRYVGRNEAYMHQFMFRRSPQRLPEEVRGPLASLLRVSEDALRSPSSRLNPTALPPTLLASLPRVQASGRADLEVPVFTERDEIDSATASEVVGRPPLLGSAGPLFALWIASDHGTRLRGGDLAFVRVNQPARPGDPVVVLSSKRLVCVGDLLEMGDQIVKINLGRNKVVEVPSKDNKVLKVACIALP